MDYNSWKTGLIYGLVIGAVLGLLLSIAWMYISTKIHYYLEEAYYERGGR